MDVNRRYLTHKPVPYITFIALTPEVLVPASYTLSVDVTVIVFLTGSYLTQKPVPGIARLTSTPSHVRDVIYPAFSSVVQVTNIRFVSAVFEKTLCPTTPVLAAVFGGAHARGSSAD